VPILFPPPGLFSTTTGTPNFSDKPWIIILASTSVVPPGGYGTTKRMGFSGYGAAVVIVEKKVRQPNNNAAYAEIWCMFTLL
jgi:hypothetical protein